MKYKVGDKVRIIDALDILEIGLVGYIVEVDGSAIPYRVATGGETYYWKAESNIELVEAAETTKETNPKDAIRTFGTGATRDTDQGKLDYVRALSPIVLKRYVQYLDKHRLQPNGSYREFDNWKKGIPQKTYHSSSGRHFMDTWLITEGYPAEDNHGPVELEDALCGQLFNIMGRLHEVLKNKTEKEKQCGQIK